MQTARLLLLSACVVASGCNLFEPTTAIAPTEADAAVDAGPSDSGQPTDAANDRDAEAIPDAADMQDEGPDTGLDVGPDGCLPPNDAELCEQLGATCGELLARDNGGVTTRINALDTGEDSTRCGDLADYFDVCSPSDGPSLVFTANADGLYLVKAHLWASQASSGPILSRLDLTRDGDTAASFQVAATASALQTYSALLPLTVGDHTFRWELTNDYYDESLPEDRNLYFDWFEIEGPMISPVDACGSIRAGIDCGTCAADERCAFDTVNQCSCPCPRPDGTCAAAGEEAEGSCAVCDPSVGRTFGGSCSDGVPCTQDVCDDETASCSNPPVTCSSGPCETGMCVAGNCEYMDRADGDTCGVGGVCAAGTCGCADGTTQESDCDDGDDNDCDGDVDCDDSDCDGERCGPGMNCSAGMCQ